MRYTTSARNPNTPRGRRQPSKLRIWACVIGLLWLYGWGGGDWTLTAAGMHGWTAPVAYVAMMLTFCYVRGRVRMLKATWQRRLRYYDPR